MKNNFNTTKNYKYLYDIPSKTISLKLYTKDNENSDSQDGCLNKVNETSYKKQIDEARKYRISGNVSAANIEKQLANINQIVFEVTDACNLKCKYCGYGEFYEDYDERENKYLPFEKAKQVIDFFASRWNSTLNSSQYKRVFLSFYGGEPLLNMDFIKKVVEYINGLHIPNVKINYSMTTNAVLLNKHIEYLAKNQFHLLISIDGDKKSNNYRTFKNGQSSFDIVSKNLKIVQQKYPVYFKNKLSINSVLHNLNSVLEVHSFCKNNYEKIPMISELNTMGIRNNKKEQFLEVYQNYNSSLDKANNCDGVIQDLEMISPKLKMLTTFIHQLSGNVFKNYNDLLYGNEKRKYLPTGTCFPFNKKVFITVNGKVLPCERIGHQFSLADFEGNLFSINTENIAMKYNEYFKKLRKQCERCYMTELCRQCLFNIDDLDNTPKCEGFKNKKEFEDFFSQQITFLSQNPELYEKIMYEITIE